MIDKTALAQRIRQLEGLTNEERSQLLELLNEQKRYGLVWEEKEEDVELQLQDELPVLTEVVEKRLPVVDGAPNHILIEGDNLHALTCLSYTHENSIDVIYIDPPYNTGNKDFVYNDRYIDTEDSFRHSKWLSFMSKRLRIAQQLLSNKGVIFISIDDNEQANLKLLCDDVFGERNFVATMPIHRQGGRQDSKHYAVVHEYLFCYAKDIGMFKAGDEIKVDNNYPKYDEQKGRYYKTQLLRKWGSNSLRENRPNLYYPITAPDGTKVYPIIYSQSNRSDLPFVKTEGRWRWSARNMDNAIREGRVEFQRNEYGEWIPYERIYAPLEGEVETKKYTTWLDNIPNGTKLLKDIFNGSTPFEYPKGLELLSLVLKMANSCSYSTILDFFAGSGTTLHAVMQLNKEDGGKRQCILVTNNENGICENVTYERNKRVIQGYTNAKGEAIEGLTNNNLRYYRTEYVPRERNHHNRLALVRAATDLLCIKNDLYAEQPILINGKKLRKDIARSFSGSGVGVAREMLIVYEPAAIPMLLGWIKERALEDKLKVYVFSDNRYAYEDDFKSVLPMIDLCALPEAIYKAYQSVRKRKMITTEALPEQENTEFQLELC